MTKKKKLLLMISNCCLIAATTIISVCAFSVAWFAHNKNVDGNGMNIDVLVDPDTMSSTISLYKFESDENAGVQYNQSTYYDHLKLNQFDNYIRSRNINNNNILKFDIKFLGSYLDTEYRDINLKAVCKTTTINSEYVYDENSTATRKHLDEVGYKYNNVEKNKDYICNSISNVIYFRSFINYYSTDGSTKTKYHSFNQVTSTTDDAIYKDATKIFNNNSIPQVTFVTKENDTYTKETEIDIHFDNIPGNTKEMEIFVEYNYSETLVDEFNNKCEESSDSTAEALTHNATIQFNTDLKTISINTSKQEEGYRS